VLACYIELLTLWRAEVSTGYPDITYIFNEHQSAWISEIKNVDLSGTEHSEV